jgi:hypothetical protein
MIQETVPLHKVEEVRHVYEPQLNELLEQGWIILAVGTGQEQTGPHDYTPVFRYSVGRIN